MPGDKDKALDEDLPEDTIIDLSQLGIVHRIYPTGRSVPESMMDPNIGGNLKKAGRNDEM